MNVAQLHTHKVGLWPLLDGSFLHFSCQVLKTSRGRRPMISVGNLFTALHFGWCVLFCIWKCIYVFCIWVPNPPLILHLSLLLLKRVWNIIFIISLQMNLRLFFRGNIEHTNAFISSPRWCVPGHPVAPLWIILKMCPAAVSAVQPHQGCAEWEEKLTSHSALLELQHQFWVIIRHVEIYHL